MSDAITSAITKQAVSQALSTDDDDPRKKKKNSDSDDSDAEPGCQWNRTVWANILHASAIVALIVNGIVLVTQLLSLETSNNSNFISTWVLNVYLLSISTLCLLAEMRKLQLCRSMVYPCLKHVYFLTAWGGRAMCYILMGTLSLDFASIFSTIAGIALLVLGITILIVNIKFNLPKYWDKAEIKKREKMKIIRRRLKAEREIEQRKADVEAEVRSRLKAQQQQSSSSLSTDADAIQYNNNSRYDEYSSTPAESVPSAKKAADEDQLDKFYREHYSDAAESSAVSAPTTTKPSKPADDPFDMGGLKFS